MTLDQMAKVFCWNRRHGEDSGCFVNNDAAPPSRHQSVDLRATLCHRHPGAQKETRQNANGLLIAATFQRGSLATSHHEGAAIWVQGGR
jgi:hypothetical protein